MSVESALSIKAAQVKLALLIGISVAIVYLFVVTPLFQIDNHLFDIGNPTGSQRPLPSPLPGIRIGGMFVDDYTNTTFINVTTMRNVQQTGSNPGAGSFVSLQSTVLPGEINSASLLGFDLVGLWHLNGNAQDGLVIRFPHHGTLMGNVTCSQTNGKWGGSCYFPTQNAWISFGDPDLFENRRAFTISAW